MKLLTFGIVFILLLLVLGGFAAYQGDRVGMAVGRKRLSIFGLRPKYTSRLITVLTGIIIVSITMASVLLISHTARQSLFGLEALQAEIGSLSRQVSTLEARQRSLLEENTELQEHNSSLIHENDQLQAQNVALREQNKVLADQQAELQMANELLRAEQSFLESRVERLAGSSYLIYDYLMQLPLIYQMNDVIGWYVVDVPDSPEKLREEILAVLARVNETVLQAGAGELEAGSGKAIVLDRSVNGVVIITEDEVIDSVVDSIWRTPGLESVVLQVIAVTHTFKGSPVQVDFGGLFRNTIVYRAGDAVDVKVFNGRESGRTLFNQLWSWLEIDVRDAAIESGLIGRSDGTVTAPIEPGALYEVVENIRRVQGPVRVRAIAAQDVHTSDELALEFMFEPLTE